GARRSAGARWEVSSARGKRSERKKVPCSGRSALPLTATPSGWAGRPRAARAAASSAGTEGSTFSARRVPAPTRMASAWARSWRHRGGGDRRTNLSPAGTAMQHDRVLLTREGKARLLAELEELRTTRRAEVAERLRVSREEGPGDAGDNTQYLETQRELALLEARIAQIERTPAQAEIVDTQHTPGGAGRPG